ncbi:MAG TPA: LysR family transcriptional regulator [Thermoanaerobaculia bacterium]|nr:LysR family transcriptional regulator [Thermoanaerobaculia bacterium]
MRRFTVRPRIRVVAEDGTIALGPGKADLLDAIARTGSIRAAASELGMSYMRAWTLIRTMNAAFRSPLVEKARGGSEQGGARLTPRGEQVLDLYKQMEQEAEKAVTRSWRVLRRHL